MRALRILLYVLGGLLLLVILAVGFVFVALNSAAGRNFAVREINRFAGPEIHVSGLGGHFPADIKLASVSVADQKGVWLTGQGLELRWKPLALLHRDIHVTDFTAAALSVARAPAPAQNKSQSQSSGGLPNVAADIDHIAVRTLVLGPELAGETVRLAATGAMHFHDPSHGSATLDAKTPDGRADYRLAAGIDPKTAKLALHVSEPPDGLIGHYAGAQVNAPLKLDATVDGPRDNAALNFALRLGAAALDGTGTLGLNPAHPRADVVLSVPALRPFAAMAGKDVAGQTRLHLIVAQEAKEAKLSLAGTVALNEAPAHLARLVGQQGTITLHATLRDDTVTIQKLDVAGAAFTIAATGTVAQDHVDLSTHARLDKIADLTGPPLAGNVALDAHIAGGTKDFGVDATLSGDVTDQDIPSGPFRIEIHATHLPQTPQGTLTGSGALEGAPLRLDAAFARAADGGATLAIKNAAWRSLDAKADLALAPGAELPTGTAKVEIKRLADFSPFSPMPLSGSLTGQFAYPGGQSFKLDVTARDLHAVPALGTIDGTVHADGQLDAVALRAEAQIAALAGHPASLNLAGTLNLKQKSARLASLAAHWNGLDPTLQGPAEILTQPGLAVRHLTIGLQGARLGVDGSFTPNLNADIVLANLPLRLASLVSPQLAATGSLSATARLHGSLKAPEGAFTVDARAVKLQSGPGAALPAATLSGGGSLKGQTGTIDLHLSAGPDLRLAAKGTVPASTSGPLDLTVKGRTDLRLLDPILAVQGTVVRGQVTADVTVTGTATAPRANGTVTLGDGSVQNIATGLNLTNMQAHLGAAGERVTLRDFSATAGHGKITGQGSVDLGNPDFPLNFTIKANQATPVASDLVTETIDADITLNGALKTGSKLAGTVKIDKANINIPHALPPSVANLPILNEGEKPPPAPPPPPPVALDLTIVAPNQIFIRGDGLFAELGGKLHFGGTASAPIPSGGFHLIRGSFALAGRNLQFSKGTIDFNGGGFIPAIDLEATTTTSENGTATLVVSGTAAKPNITLTSSPPLPSDEILAQLLFHESTTSLTPFQAASLAAALAQLSGIGGGTNPLDSVRNALGLDQLSLSGSGSGPPSVQAGRYVAPGVYVGATQATSGQGTQATVEINLSKGLKLTTSTGTSSTGSGDSSSVGLTYQFNY